MHSKISALRGDDIRKGNEKLVLRLIQQYGTISQSETVELTGLKAPTILRIFTNLKNLDLIQISNTKKTEPTVKKGRKPVYFSLNPDALFVIGVEFWSLSATVVVSNFTRIPVYSESISLDRDLDGNKVLFKIVELIKNSITELRISTNQIIGVGIGAPGRVDINEGSVQFYSRINGLNGMNIKQFLEKNLNLDVHVHNNTSVITMHEFRDTLSVKTRNIFTILIRGGVGGSYINDGRIVTSGNISSLEIGHMSVNPNGRRCSCGWQGCLETYLSEGVILQDIHDSGVDTVDIESIGNLISCRDSEESETARKVLDEKSRLLAYAIKNITNILSPDIFLLISRNIGLSTYFADQVREKLEKYPAYPEKHISEILPLQYDPLHAGLGACDIVFQSFFMNHAVL
jgi:predicted NBD/HSP70 family sugar kinase